MKSQDTAVRIIRVEKEDLPPRAHAALDDLNRDDARQMRRRDWSHRRSAEGEALPYRALAMDRHRDGCKGNTFTVVKLIEVLP